MAYANGTTHYNLPLTVGSDKRDWADTNQAFSDLDAAVYAAVTDTGTQETEISALETRMDTAEQNISGNASDIAALDTRLTTAEGSITSQAAAIDDVRSDGEDMICAYNEATATSTHAYSIGDYFIYNNVLYRVTTGIAIGDTIVPDTNCTTTNVTTELLSAGSDAVDMICTVTENTNTATRNYAVGDYFILNDVLYKVTATITVGTTIIPGTNCTSSTVMSEIKSSFNDIDTFKYGNPITNIAPAYDVTANYAIGDIVSYVNSSHVGKVFKCIEPITTPEVFTPAHWSEIDVSNTFKPVVVLNTLNATATDTWREVIRYLTKDFIEQLTSTSMIEMDTGTNKIYYRADTLAGGVLQFSHVAMSSSALVVYTIGADIQGGPGSRYAVTVSSSGASFNDDSLGLTGVATFRLYK